MYILIRKAAIKFLAQDIVNGMDNKIHAFHGCINDTQLIHGLRESTLEELLILIFDKHLLSFQIVYIKKKKKTQKNAHVLIEFIQYLRILFHGLALQ